jgi:hypothetical protein
VAADICELRSWAATIEQILRTGRVSRDPATLAGRAGTLTRPERAITLSRPITKKQTARLRRSCRLVASRRDDVLLSLPAKPGDEEVRSGRARWRPRPGGGLATLHTLCNYARDRPESQPVSREVLAAARRLAERDTLAGTSLTEFPREAGVTRLTSYRRGETRAASLEALRDGERDVLVPILASPGNARARLEHALEAMCDRTDARAELLSGLDAATLNAVYREEGEEARSKSFGPIVRRLRDGSSTDPSEPCPGRGQDRALRTDF